jgi:hypothetical protein
MGIEPTACAHLICASFLLLSPTPVAQVTRLRPSTLLSRFAGEAIISHVLGGISLAARESATSLSCEKIACRSTPCGFTADLRPMRHAQFAGLVEVACPLCLNVSGDGLCIEVSVSISLPVAFRFSIPVGPTIADADYVLNWYCQSLPCKVCPPIILLL